MAAQYFTFGVPLTADQLGQPGGPASLEASGRAPLAQMPIALEEAAGTVATRYLGAIDNAVALSSGGISLQTPGPVWNGSTRVAGSYFVVTAAGTTAATVGDIPAGTPLAAGARVVSTGTAWAYDEALRYVATRDLFDGAVTAPKIAADAVTTAKIAAGAVGLPALAPATVSDLDFPPGLNVMLSTAVTNSNGTGTFTNLVYDAATRDPPNVFSRLARTGAQAGSSSILLVSFYTVPPNATAWVDIRWSVRVGVTTVASEGGVAGATQALGAGNTRVVRLGRTPANPGASAVLATLASGAPAAVNAWTEVALDMSGVAAVPGDVLMVQTVLFATRAAALTETYYRYIKYTTTRAGAY